VRWARVRGETYLHRPFALDNALTLGGKGTWEDGHVSEVARHDESVAAYECFSCRADPALAGGRERDICRARVAAGEGPFGFAVADEEDAGGGHGGLITLEESREGGREFGWRLGGSWVVRGETHKKKKSRCRKKNGTEAVI
jgi:hypothetical protein